VPTFFYQSTAKSFWSLTNQSDGKLPIRESHYEGRFKNSLTVIWGVPNLTYLIEVAEKSFYLKEKRYSGL
jgi:hypothetical protein